MAEHIRPFVGIRKPVGERELTHDRAAPPHCGTVDFQLGRPRLGPMNARQVHEVAVAGNHVPAEKVTETRPLSK